MMAHIENLDFREAFNAGRAEAERDRHQEMMQERRAREKAERQRTLFDSAVKDWLAFASLKKPIKIQKCGDGLLQRLRQWAKNQPLEVLESFNAFYPFSNSLSGFKWLPEGLLEEKRRQAKLTPVTAGAGEGGAQPRSETLQNVIDDFLAEVHKIPGDKILTISTKNPSPGI